MLRFSSKSKISLRPLRCRLEAKSTAFRAPDLAQIRGHSNSKGPISSSEAASNPFSYAKSDHCTPSLVRETRAVMVPQEKSPHSGQTNSGTRCPSTRTSDVNMAVVTTLISRAASGSKCGFESEPHISYLEARVTSNRDAPLTTKSNECRSRFWGLALPIRRSGASSSRSVIRPPFHSTDIVLVVCRRDTTGPPRARPSPLHKLRLPVANHSSRHRHGADRRK